MRRYRTWAGVVVIAGIAFLLMRQRLLVPVHVQRSVVEQGEVVREVFGRATLESRREVQLGFDLVGRISDVLVDEGDRVKLGQVVAHLEPVQVNADVRAATSGESLARAAVARLAADERRATEVLRFAEQDAARIRALAASGSVSPRDLDLAEQQLTLAHADLDRVHAAEVEAQKEIAVASGATASKAATVTRAVLVSPFDGVVVRRFKDPGDTVVVGTTVLRVVAVDRLWARASIDESMLADTREGMPATIALFADPGNVHVGTVDRVGSEVDRQTHEALVDVLLSKAPPRLAMGQRADVYIAVERRPGALRIPLPFLRNDSGGAFVFADNAGRIARVAVQVGIMGRDVVEITQGLTLGDAVLNSIVPGGMLAAGRRWSAEP